MTSYNKVPIDGEKVPIDGEKVPIDGEKVPIDGERQKISPYRIRTYKRNFPYISLHSLTDYETETPLPFALGYGQGLKRTKARTPNTAGGAWRETDTDTADAGFESRPVLTGGKQALRPLIIHSGHRKRA